MKRVFACFFVLIIAIGLIEANAEKQELTWQGIQWESSVEEVIQALIDEEVIDEKIANSRLEHLNRRANYLGPWNSILIHKSIDQGFQLIINKGINTEAKRGLNPIAGYNVQGIHFCFASNGDVSKLLSVQVVLDIEDYNITDMYNDLHNKLEKAYNEYSWVDVPTGDPSAYWEGLNNTVIYLIKSPISIIIEYATLDAETIIEQMPKGDNMNDTDPNNIDGL